MNRKQRRQAQARQPQAALSHTQRDQLLQRGLDSLQADRVADARQAFAAVLKADAKDPDALHLDGMARLRLGDEKAARVQIRKALKQAPDNVGYWISLASVEEGLGNAKATEQAYDKALTLQPGNAEAWNNYGTFLLPQGRVAEAEKAYLRAVKLAPDYLQALYNLAVLLLNTGRMELSIACFEKGLEIEPDHPEFLINYGVALQRMKRLDEARATQEKLLAMMPGNPGALTNLSSVYYDAGQLKEAEAYGRKAVEAAPDLAPAWNNLGNALAAQDVTEEAEAAFRKSLELSPDYTEVLVNLANLLDDSGRPEEAEALYRQAVEQEPDNPRHRYHLGISHLVHGNLRDGWPLYEAGFASGDRRPDRTASHPAPRWQGESLGKGCLHIWPEQGIGDEIGTALLYEQARRAAGPEATIVIECDPRLVTILQRSFPWATVLPEGEFDLAQATAQTPLFGLMQVFWQAVADIEPQAGFLAPDPDRLADCRDRLTALGDGPKVGIAWGSALVNARRATAFAGLDQWGDVLSVPGMRFVNLQYGDREAEIAEAEKAFGVPIHRWPDIDLKDDLEAALALTASVDLVINMSTSAGDIAAAAGTDCWTLLRAPSWPLFGTDRLPQYASVTVYGRRRDQSWSEILGRVAQDLNIWQDRVSR